MKKAAMIACAVMLFFAASVNAQTDTVPSPEKQVMPAEPVTPMEPVTPTDPTAMQQDSMTQPLVTTTTSPISNDLWNNYDPEKYKLAPMPEPLTIEKIFPAIGNYTVTDKEGAESTVNISIDPENKGVIWVEGLPQGRLKAYLRQSPGVYKIPAQKLEDEKSLAEGVLIVDKDMNTIDVCIGCNYNVEEPAVAFADQNDEAVEAETETKVKKGTVKTKTKVKPVKTWRYSGEKHIVETAVVPGTPLQ